MMAKERRAMRTVVSHLLTSWGLITAASPGGECMKIKDPNHLRYLGTLLIMCPEPSADVLTKLHFLKYGLHC